MSVSIYYGTQSDIRVKSYCRLNWLRGSKFIFDSIYFGTQSDIRVKSYCLLNLLRASTFKFERLVIYRTQSIIRVKSYCRLNWLRASTFNFERLNILRDSIRHPSKKLLSFELAQSFNIQFRASQYITGLNQTFE